VVAIVCGRRADASSTAGSLAGAVEERVLAQLSQELSEHISPQKHASVIELATRIPLDAACSRARGCDAAGLNGIPDAVPVRRARSANSPFCQGRDIGFASAWTVIFMGFPHGNGLAFRGYVAFAEAVDVLITSGAVPIGACCGGTCACRRRWGRWVGMMDAQRPARRTTFTYSSPRFPPL
jgi:hypothetical protein